MNLSSIQWFLPISVATVSAAGGFVVGRVSAPPRMPPTEQASASASGEVSAEPGGVLVRTPSEGSSPTVGGGGPVGAKVLPVTAAEVKTIMSELEKGGFHSNSMRVVANLQERLLVSDLPTLARALVANGDARGMQSIYMVMAAYSEKDPDGALTLALSLPPGMARSSALSAAVSSLALKNPEAALARLPTIEDAETRRQLRSTIINALTEKDPRRALQLAMEGSESEQFQVSMIFQRWAMRDLNGAKAALSSLTGPAAAQARAGLVQAIASTNPAEAWKVASEMGAGSGRSQMDPRSAVIGQWAQTDPKAAVEAASQVSQASMRENLMSNAMRTWAQVDFDAALQYAKSLSDPSIRAEALVAMVSGQGKPSALFDEILANVPPGRRFQNAMTNLLAQWGDKDPKAAAAATMRLPAGSVFSSAASQIASRWAASSLDKKEPLNWVLSLPEGEARRNSLQSVMREWAQSDVAAAARAIPSLPAGDQKSVLSSVAEAWSENDPKGAIAWASGFADENARQQIYRAATSRWAQDDPEAATAAVSTLPAAARDAAVGNVVRVWASSDTNAAAQWVSKMPADRTKDQALNALTQQMAQEDPETAIAWAGQINDTNMRTRQTENLARTWMRVDPASARQWVASSTLPKETKERLLK